MNFLTDLLSPTMMRLIALTLLHFLWQGAALAALAYAGMAFCRSASARYGLAAIMLVAMALAPGITMLTLLLQELARDSATVSQPVSLQPSVGSGTAQFVAKTTASESAGMPGYFLWLVEIWFVGVMLFSLRSAGGVFVVERLRRQESNPVSDRLLELCLTLQDRMGVNRLVNFYECVRLEAPAVAGWLRPAVMLPVTALTGLSDEQLSLLIAHELAHIKRFDPFVNLFQIAVETLLFYHPAIWWLNQRIREERENCCDDMAVAVCGNPLTYAHALARLAESRTSPRLIMAANSRPLAARVARLLGVGNTSEAIRGADLSLGLFCLSAALIAGGAFIGAARNMDAQTPVTTQPLPGAPVAAVARPIVNAAPARISNVPLPAEPIPAPKPVPLPATVAVPQVASEARQVPASSYIDGLKAAGLQNLTVDQLIALKIQGVTPEYVKSMGNLGVHPDADELVGMKIQGITPEYVRGMREATGESLDINDLIGMKIQGVTPEYVKQIHDLGLKADAGELVGMKIQGISPEYIREMRSLDLKPDTGDLIGMKVQGITPEYVKSINALGLHPDAGDLIGMKVQGVDADYLKKMQAAGIKLDVGEAIDAKVQGVTPEFIERARSHGFKDLSLHQLIALKHSGVLDDPKQ